MATTITRGRLRRLAELRPAHGRAPPVLLDTAPPQCATQPAAGRPPGLAPTIARGRLRRLAELRPANGRVLSVFLDLDPSEFATPPARATRINATPTEAAALTEVQKD